MTSCGAARRLVELERQCGDGWALSAASVLDYFIELAAEGRLAEFNQAFVRLTGRVPALGPFLLDILPVVILIHYPPLASRLSALDPSSAERDRDEWLDQIANSMMEQPAFFATVQSLAVGGRH